MANEETIIKVMPLPAGREWVWFGDLNCVALSDRLDEAGRMVALMDLQAQWRRTMLHVISPRPREAQPPSRPPSYTLMHNGAGEPAKGA